MKVLLHTCCGPCFIYPLEVLRKDGFEVEAYFYNPNIYPEDEYLRRKGAFLDFANNQALRLHIPDYGESDFKNAVTERERPDRCMSCWRLRLSKAGEFARINGIPAFTTALLASPYQDRESLKNIGEEIARIHNVEFLFRDFRAGFRDAHNKARALGLYCQKYCGCSHSLEERNAVLSARQAAKEKIGEGERK